MFTKNYTELIANSYLNKQSCNNSNHPWNCKTIEGITLSNVFGANMNDRISSYTAHVGSGTTPPTADDYALENRIVNGVSIISCDITNTNGVVGFHCTVYNSGSSPITITEFGIVAENVIKSNSNAGSVLLSRDVFDEVTVQPEETISFYIRIA